jgi:anti-anti-sigma factor
MLLDGPRPDTVDSEVIVVSMSGELDPVREHELVNVVVTLEPPPGTIVELDMCDVTFVDSSGLKSIIHARAYLRGRGCELRVTRPRRAFLRILELTGLADELVVDRDRVADR